jgi:signal transduction histidine kinase
MNSINFYYKLVDNYYTKLNPVNLDTLSIIEILPLRPLVCSEVPIITTEQYILNHIFPIQLKKGHYFVLVTDKVIAFKIISFYQKYSPSSLELFHNNIRYITELFRREHKESLLNSIFEGDEISHTLTSINKYIFTEHYSLWLYNPITKYFTIFCSSYDADDEFYHINDKNCQLAHLIDIKDDYLYSDLSKINDLPHCLLDMKSANYIRISEEVASTDVTAILSFYSKHDRFKIRSETVSQIKAIVGLRISKLYLPYIKKVNSMLNQLNNGYKLGVLTSFLEQSVTGICEILDYESASIFILNKSKNILQLRGSYQCGRICTDESVSYPLDNESCTVTVFKSNETKVSYDISSDPYNSHIYDEITSSKSQNWIGVPIKTKNNNHVIGVLRAKNKLYKGNVVPCNKLDIEILQQLADIIGHHYQTDDSYLKEQIDKEAKITKQKEEYDKLSEFLRTFRHEIKSPLIVVTQASNVIRNELGRIHKVLPKSVSNTLNDLDMVGDRLSFVSNVLTFDAHELVRDIRPSLPLVDIVAPVLKFATPWASNRKIHIEFDKNSLMLPMSMCDPYSVQMVVHILLDNAIKYSKKKTTIHIYGKDSPPYSCIIFENEGVEILPSEKDTIFNKFSRGSYAITQRIEGSGIGLFVAREIMKLNDGKLSLISAKTPVRFEISLLQSIGG